MKCPKCSFEQGSGLSECQRCGVIFAKLDKNTAPHSPILPQQGVADVDVDETPLQSLLWPYRPQGRLVLVGRLLLLLVLLFLTFRFGISSIKQGAAGNSFLHMVNLPFHEAGHIFSRPFGRIITSLGGTLGQLLMPIICLIVLLFQTRDPFGGAVCLWWVGENLLDIAPYIDDARTLSLPLVGGNFGYSSPYGFHDWQFILTELGLLRFDHFIARLSHLFGLGLSVVALSWAGFVLFKGLSHSDSELLG